MMAVSLSGLDLSFFGKKDANAVERGRFKYDAEEGVIPAWLHHVKNHREPARSDLPSPYFVPDVDAIYGGEWKSIVDGSTISSRSNWREHNKRNGVVDVGDKFWSADGDDITRTREKMGFDPTLINKTDPGEDGTTCTWVRPRAVGKK